MNLKNVKGLITGRGQHGYHTGDATGRSEVINTTTATDTRPTSSKIKESASGVKGLAAAVHGAGETIRGNVNATVDRAFNDVGLPITFPTLGNLYTQLLHSSQREKELQKTSPSIRMVSWYLEAKIK